MHVSCVVWYVAVWCCRAEEASSKSLPFTWAAGGGGGQTWGLGGLRILRMGQEAITGIELVSTGNGGRLAWCLGIMWTGTTPTGAIPIARTARA